MITINYEPFPDSYYYLSPRSSLVTSLNLDTSFLVCETNYCLNKQGLCSNRCPQYGNMVKKNTLFTGHLSMAASAKQTDETSIQAIGIPKERSILPER